MHSSTVSINIIITIVKKAAAADVPSSRSIHEAQLAQTESLMMFVGRIDLFLLDVSLLGRVSSRNGEMKRFFCLFF